MKLRLELIARCGWITAHSEAFLLVGG